MSSLIKKNTITLTRGDTLTTGGTNKVIATNTWLVFSHTFLV